MKVPRILITAFTLAVSATHPCMAISPDATGVNRTPESSNAQKSNVGDGDESGAKGLFRRQLDQPSEKLNTGIEYWIELHRDGQVLRANNKTVFQAGDDISFHVTPNIDGYAYILLSSGSRGEKAVLFPDEQKAESNHVARGEEIVLPGKNGVFSFDKNPGTEKVTLLVSRLPIDAQAYLADPPGSSKERVGLIAMNSGGSKDLVPDDVKTDYGAERLINHNLDRADENGMKDTKPSVRKVAAKNTDLGAVWLINHNVSKEEEQVKNPKDTKPSIEKGAAKDAAVADDMMMHDIEQGVSHRSRSPVPQVAKTKTLTRPDRLMAAKPKQTQHKPTSLVDHAKLAQSNAVHHTPDRSTIIAASPEPTTHGEASHLIDKDTEGNIHKGRFDAQLKDSVVTIVRNNPDGVLAADIILEHR